MPTGWETYPLEVNGGLVTNLSLLQQGLKLPGSARILTNFEPSVRGGYRRINGYTKFSSSTVPVYGDPRVQGSGQTGTTLVIGNILTKPALESTFTIAGVTDTYEISSIVYDDTSKEATVTLTTPLASSPADNALITFTNKVSSINGIDYFENAAIAFRDDSFWQSSGTGWVKISARDLGSVLVDGASQTGTSLVVDGLTGVPSVGDTFRIDGVEKVYAVVSEPTVTSGGATITISPALASSPADNAALTFISSNLGGGGIVRSEVYNYSGTRKVVFVDGVNYPSTWSGTKFDTIKGTTDILGAEHVVDFRDHMFFAKGSLVAFSAPFDENDFSAANGAGSIRLPDDVTGMMIFRDQLILFTKTTIHNLTGNSIADFQLNYITHKLGCIQPDTLQEVGGDIAFLGPDGVRLISATDRIGDFGIATISRPIQDDITLFSSEATNFCSVVVRKKSQYRIFGFVPRRTTTSSEGYIGTQFISQDASSFAWGKIEGIKARVACSVYEDSDENVLFAGEDGYVYRMESGDTFDGNTINALFYTPYLPLSDPLIRKTIYKTHSYFNPEGVIEGNLTIKYDFQEPDKVQPSANDVDNNSTGFSLYGSATYGSSNFGSNPNSIITQQAIGSCNTVSLQYHFTSDAPFIIDTILIEFSNKGRK